MRLWPHFGHFLLPWPQISIFSRSIFSHKPRIPPLMPLDPTQNATLRKRPNTTVQNSKILTFSRRNFGATPHRVREHFEISAA
jgi:hypothetical protein